MLCPFLLPAQEPFLEVTQYQEKAEIGDQVDIYIKLRQSENLVVNWPDVKESIEGLEVLHITGIDTAKQDGQLVLTQAIKVTAWDSGAYKIPSLPFSYSIKGDTVLNTANSPESIITFTRLPIDTSRAIAPIQEPLDVPYTFEEFLPYILTGVAVLILIITIFLLIRHYRKPKEKIVKQPPPIPAHVWALEKLKELENLKLWQNGAIKEYYISLTDIFRHYVERRYSIRAMESTTGELMADLKDQKVKRELLEQVEYMLREADMVKFAKATPPETDHVQNLEIAFSFVEKTKRRPEPQPAPEAIIAEEETQEDEIKTDTR
ncbi:MAG: hypothetical protein WD077_15075 [Bacteroidia bacterium]